MRILLSGRSPTTLLLLLLAALPVASPVAAQAPLLPQGPQGPVDVLEIQGRWEGSGPPGAIVVTISGDELHFFARDDLWYETRFVLLDGTSPQQLEATIHDSAPPARDRGEVVIALISLRDDVLVLAVDDGSDTAPASIADALSVYELRRVAGPAPLPEPPF